MPPDNKTVTLYAIDDGYGGPEIVAVPATERAKTYLIPREYASRHFHYRTTFNKEQALGRDVFLTAEDAARRLLSGAESGLRISRERLESSKCYYAAVVELVKQYGIEPGGEA